MNQNFDSRRVYKAYENWKEGSKNEQAYWEGEKSGYQMDAHREKDGKQKDTAPKSNGAQNDQFEGAFKEIERKLGKKLDRSDREKLHRHVTILFVNQNFDSRRVYMP